MVDRETIEYAALNFLLAILSAVMALVVLAMLFTLPLIGIAVCISFTPWLGVPLTVLLSLVSLAIAVLLVGAIRD